MGVTTSLRGGTRLRRVVVLVATATILLVTFVAQRVSYRWCPSMGASWTSSGCCVHERSADDGREEPVASSPSCCETRQLEALPRAEATRADERIPARAEPIAIVAVVIPQRRSQRSADAPPRGGVPPPSLQRRLAALSLLRI